MSESNSQTSSVKHGPKIKKEDIVMPTISFTNAALSELNLIVENDFTLAGKYLRILISGKGCDGFKYSVGFTDREENDFLVAIDNAGGLEVLVDPFAAFYLGETEVDYIQDFQSNNEGFTVVNKDQEMFQGKFWRGNKDLVPPLVQQ